MEKNVKKIIKELRKQKARRIFIQYPEGLKTKIQELSKEIEKNGLEVILCCEQSFGACDVRDEEAIRLGCNAILHIGHSDFGVKSKLPVIYFDYLFEINPNRILNKEIDKLKGFGRIGLITSLQFIKAMEKVKEYLEKKGKKVLVHKSLKYPGQILGCNLEAAEKIEDKVDCFLYVGAGKFHPLGVAIKTIKPVFSLDLEKKELYSLETERKKWLKKKAWYDSRLEEARKVGIIVCWKKGQNRIEEAFKIKRKLEKKGKEVTILAFDNFKKEKIEGLKFDFILNFACPRLEEEIF